MLEVKNGIKSKERVKESGEVFTPRNIVCEMLDQEDIDKSIRMLDDTVLEPTCGNGNFLVEILARKLEAAKLLSKSNEEFNLNAVKAVSRIYGVDIMCDNIYESKLRMHRVIDEYYELLGYDMDSRVKKSIEFIMDRNIIAGDILAMNMRSKIVNSHIKGEKFDEAGTVKMVTCKWDFNGDKITRTDYYTKELLKDESEQQHKNCEYATVKYNMAYRLEDIEESDLDW